MDASVDRRREVARARRASAMAIAVLPVTLLVVILVAILFSGLGWDSPVAALWMTGLTLMGPFVSHAAGPLGWWVYPTLACLLLIAWALAARYTRVGDMHWVLHGAIVMIWMMFGFYGFMRVAMST